MKPALFNENGTVLITTLGVIAVLLVSAVQVARLSGDTALQTAARKARFLSEQKAMSGIHLAMLVLSRDAADNETDSLQEPWADPELLSGALQTIGLDPAHAKLVIEDEMGKIQLNALIKQFPGNEINTGQQALWERFFSLLQTADNLDLEESTSSIYQKLKEDENLEDLDPVEIVNAAKDWLDSNDNDAITGLSGAESDYYEALEIPYTCTNGPFGHIEEFFDVKGVPAWLKTAGLDTLLTVYGMASAANEAERCTWSGKININTAPVEVLAALLPEGRDGLAQDLVDFRMEKAEEDENFTHTLEDGWYEQVINLSSEEKLAFSKKISYSSHIYRITCAAEEQGTRYSLSAVVLREKQADSGTWICRMLQLEKDKPWPPSF